MSSISQEISALSAEERELFLLLLEQEGVNVGDMIIPQRRDSDALPLSLTQHRLWTSSMFARDTAFGNVPLTFRINGPLQLAAVQQSLNAIIERHEILRTTYRVIDGVTMQIVAPIWQPELHIVNLESFPEQKRFSEAVRQATAEVQRPFDFGSEPPLRALLVRLSDDDHLLQITLNHLVSDGWGIRVLLREFSAHYRHFAAGEVVELPELPIQYADFGIWQKEWLQGEELQKQLAYWEEQLAGTPIELALPLDRARPQRPSFSSAIHKFKWSSSFSKALKEFSRSQGVTLFPTLLAAWQTALHVYTGQKDVIVGTTISNRGRSETENMIGNFGNNLQLRASFANDPSFRNLLQQLHEVTMGAFAHQDLPLEMLNEALRKSVQNQKVPLFQTIFIQRDSSLAENLSLGTLTTQHVSIDVGMSSLELALDITDSPEGLYGSLEYLTAIFDEATIAEMLFSFERVLENVVANPQLRASDLDALVIVPEKKVESVSANGHSATTSAASEEQARKQQNGHAGILPQTELEKTIASIWQEVLELNYVGVDDNFFDLGARSLHVAQVHTRVNRTINKNISILDLFEHPTINTLAQFIRGDQTEHDESMSQKQRADARRASRARRRRSAR